MRCHDVLPAVLDRRPVQGRGLKLPKNAGDRINLSLLPSRGRGLKSVHASVWRELRGSLPTRGWVENSSVLRSGR